MLRRQARAQRADAAGADDGDAQFLALDGRLLERAAILYQALTGGSRHRLLEKNQECGPKDEG
jgi:hypothetical protein